MQNASALDKYERQCRDLQNILLQHKEEADQQMASRDQIIETLSLSLTSLNDQLTGQQVQFETRLRQVEEECAWQMKQLQASLQESELLRVRFAQEREALAHEKEALKDQVDKMETVTAMQTEEITRLSLEAGKTSLQIDGGLNVSKDSLIKLT